MSDAEWEFVRPLLPVSLRGRKRLDDRRVLNGIVWKFRTGWPGGMCPRGMGRGPRCIRVFAGGRRTGRR
ncbi:transposase [Streptomyces sp. NPDC057552]|uniref:transposase n=1 Tax=Streptomyces sp. NPDC057552 TaxID=3350537 RepID=UPI0036C7F23B